MSGYDECFYPSNAMGDTSEMLRAAISANPYMRVVCLNGYFDLATPFFGTEYTFAHMDLEPELRDNVKMEYYTAGHMVRTNLWLNAVVPDSCF